MTAVGDSSVDAWSEAAGMASMHGCRSQAELAEFLAAELQRLLPDFPLAVCLAVDGGSGGRVEWAAGAGCPWRTGETVDLSTWDVADEQQLPIRYREHLLGSLVSGRPLDGRERAALTAVLAHYGVALANLTLDAESREATEGYCASLQALEEGIVLFQEEDPEAVRARLLSLASSMLHATAGALYALRRIGDVESGLALEATLGMPEAMLETFVSADGSAWPDGLLQQATQLLERDESGGLAGLDPAVLPPVLDNLVAMPLRYHGIEAGICILFNCGIDADHGRDHLGRVQSLGQLGAALLHRLQLEAIAAQNRAIARELQIAETIQKRLMPTTAPSTDEYEFAWSSIAAQHIGGDYLDVMATDDGDLHAVVADVSGHGINSALLMSSFRSTYRGDAPWLQPGDLAASLNSGVVHEVGATGMFITAVALRLRGGSREMTMTSAGHNPVLIFRQDGGVVEMIDSDGPPLGFLAGATFGEKSFRLATGDVVLLYTDGVTEATDPDLEMYGEERLAGLLAREAGSAAEAIVQAIRDDLSRFTGGDRFDDDVSILVVRVT